MKYRTRQEKFDRVWDCFITQKQPACRDLSNHGHNKGLCSYTPTGKNTVGCAVGCLLEPDIQKKFQKNNTGILDFLNATKEHQELYLKVFNKEDEFFLNDLQIIHDTMFDDFELELRALAERYNLKVPNESNN